MGGTPLPPFTDKIFGKKGVTDLGGTPQIRNSLFAENFVRKGGEGGTPHIRNLFFGPKTGVFWAKNTIFSTF